MRILSILVTTAAFLAVPAAAQTPSSPQKAALSKSCSDQANAKGLHGKARKKFRSACKRGH